VPVHGGAVLEGFTHLLAEARRQAAHTRVLVLGDLLESLVNERQLDAGAWPRLLAELRATTAAGVPITLLHGNRDFMLGTRFAAKTGVRVVPGGLAFTLGNARALALHGDELCTNDRPYQASKRWLRTRVVRWLCAAMPVAVADYVARRARAASGKSVAAGDQARFAPVTEAVRAALSSGFEILVFGHVHTPAHGTLGAGRYWILPAFDATAAFLAHDGAGELRFARLGDDAAPQFGPLTFAAAQR
jgi:UDP-2,3-diacylglucosamine hydrolase